MWYINGLLQAWSFGMLLDTDGYKDLVEKNCEEVVLSDPYEDFSFKPLCVDNVEFFVRDIPDEDDVSNGPFMKSYKDCDVIPSIYEGGLKIWECTYDLLLFLMRNEVSFKNKTVLDLGCGCGLVGIFAGMKGAKNIHFHDYNFEVLSDFTMPNVNRNNIESVSKFFSGDWKNFMYSPFVKSVQYDYILTSETLYNTSNYSKLHELFCVMLKHQGEIYIASKSYYFGVGGSVQQFQEYLNDHKLLRWETVWKTDEGNVNVHNGATNLLRNFVANFFNWYLLPTKWCQTSITFLQSTILLKVCRERYCG